MTIEHNKDFMKEEDVEDYFNNYFKDLEQRKGIPISNNFQPWFKHGGEHPRTYGHHDNIGNGDYTCDTIVDKFVEKWYKTSSSLHPMFHQGSYIGGNPFLFKTHNTSIYFLSSTPFLNPDIRTLTMTEPTPVLIGYLSTSSLTEFPSKKTFQDLKDFILEDLTNIQGDSIKATFDGEPIYGCPVIRQEPLKISNIPEDNVVGIPTERMPGGDDFILEVIHGGFWIALKPENFTSGDHLLEFKVDSKNYRTNVIYTINSLV